MAEPDREGDDAGGGADVVAAVDGVEPEVVVVRASLAADSVSPHIAATSWISR